MALPPFLSGDDLLKFRTRHCQRFLKQGYCNFGEKCQYSHNIEWTRRPLWKYNYTAQLCHFMRDLLGKGKNTRFQYSCCLHRQCPLAHSYEEQIYHPKVYKRVLCESHINTHCLRYYCPFAHGTAELQGDGFVDTDLLKTLTIPQAVLCPLDTHSTQAHQSIAGQHQDHQQSNKMYPQAPWTLLRSKLSLPLKPPITTKALSITNGLQPTSASSIPITPHGFQNIQLQQQNKNGLEYLWKNSQIPVPPQTVNQKHAQHPIKEAPLSQVRQDHYGKPSTGIDTVPPYDAHGELMVNRESFAKKNSSTDPYSFSHLINYIISSGCQPSQREICFPLDSNVMFVTLTWFKPNTIHDGAPPVSVVQVKCQDPDILSRCYTKLCTFVEYRLPSLLYVVRHPFASELFDNKDIGDNEGVWIVFPADSTIQETQLLTKKMLVMRPHNWTQSNMLDYSLETVLEFLLQIKRIHSSGYPHGHITPWLLCQETTTHALPFDQLLYGALPLLTNYLSWNYLMCQSVEILGAIITKNQVMIEKNQTLATDVWSCGICISVWLNDAYGHPYGNTPDEIINNIVCDNKCNLSKARKKTGPLLYHLLSCMLEHNSTNRISIHQATEHPLFWFSHPPQFFLDMLCCALSAPTACSATYSYLNTSVEWLNSLRAHLHNTCDDNELLACFNQSIGVPEDLLHFVQYCLSTCNTTDSDSRQVLRISSNHTLITDAITNQSSIGLLYFLCLFYVTETPIKSIRKSVLQFFCDRYAEVLIHLRTFLWDARSYDMPTSQLALPLPTSPELLGSTRPHDADEIQGTKQRPRTNLHRIQEMRLPTSPAFSKCTPSLLEDLLDGESTTASSTCSHFVQSLLSFMGEDI